MTKPGKAKQRLEEGAPAEPEQQLKPERAQDVNSTRAKNTGHKKVTADKWNQ